MARFLAKHANYGHGVQTGSWMVLKDGQRQEVKKHLHAKFSKAGVSPEEQEIGIREFVHNGLPEDRDTEQLYSPRNRISVFDTLIAQAHHGWTDQEREIVELALRNSPHYGMEFIEVTKPPVPKPWPTYDETTDVVGIANAIGVPLADVLAYELENLNREDFVRTLMEAINGPNEEEEDLLTITA